MLRAPAVLSLVALASAAGAPRWIAEVPGAGWGPWDATVRRARTRSAAARS